MQSRSLSIGFLLVSFWLVSSDCQAQDRSVPFTWDNAIVYFAMTDRFENADPSNDNAYDRGLDGAGNAYDSPAPGAFWGGDFAGLTQKIDEGYFTDLGVTAIWISPVVEQIHGWVGSADGESQVYGYHGYWLLDPTEIDANFGSRDELAGMIGAAHEKNIKVIVDLVLNHPGYATLTDMDNFGFGGLDRAWRNWRPGENENWNSYHNLFIDYSAGPTANPDTAAIPNMWSNWWGDDWVRAGVGGYAPCGNTELTTCTSFLPDFKTEQGSDVDLPPILRRKWSDAKLASQTKELDAFFNRTGFPRTPAYYMIKWATDLVREFGFDGYRIDTAKHVAPQVWDDLLVEAKTAHANYLSNSTLPPDFVPSEFWAVAEDFGYAPGDTSVLKSSDIDALTNFEIQHVDLLDTPTADSIYLAYSDVVADQDNPSLLSYISSHDTGLASRDSNHNLASRFVMLPGAIQLFYGDETARDPDPTVQIPESYRSPMDWAQVDGDLLAHWQKLLRFRANHPAIGAGTHEMIQAEPYTFLRRLNYGTFEDNVVIVVGAEGRTRLNVSKAFPEDSIVRDAYSGKTGFVTFGFVNLVPHPSGVMLLELVD